MWPESDAQRGGVIGELCGPRSTLQLVLLGRLLSAFLWNPLEMEDVLVWRRFSPSELTEDLALPQRGEGRCIHLILANQSRARPGKEWQFLPLRSLRPRACCSTVRGLVPPRTSEQALDYPLPAHPTSSSPGRQRGLLKAQQPGSREPTAGPPGAAPSPLWASVYPSVPKRLDEMTPRVSFRACEGLSCRPARKGFQMRNRDFQTQHPRLSQLMALSISLSFSCS